MIKFLYICNMKNIIKKYKRGDKHPTNKNLIFWQYHHPYFKKTNGECWLNFIEFNKRREKHRLSTKKYKVKHPLMYIVLGTIQRDIKKYQTNSKEIINLNFIKELLKKQNNKCYWFNIELEVDSLENTRNPSKLTIDRLNCSIGYSKNNVVLSSYAANCGRADCSVKDWLLIIKNIKNGLNTKSN